MDQLHDDGKLDVDQWDRQEILQHSRISLQQWRQSGYHQSCDSYHIGESRGVRKLKPCTDCCDERLLNLLL